MDCSHFIEKGLHKTRLVEFHRGKLAISEILLYGLIFKVWGLSHLPMGNSTTKNENLISIFRGICVGGGAENGGVGATVRREGYSLTATIFRFVYNNTLEL